jgi:glucose-6-phosphate 1-dehydrogenase
MVRLKRIPTAYSSLVIASNHLRFRISPDVSFAFGMLNMVAGEKMEGDATDFARQDYIEEAWRIVDPCLSSDTPVYENDPKTWGPAEVAQKLKPEGGWHYPEILNQT